jgi:hypothetical protein
MAELQVFATFKRDPKEEIARLRRLGEEKKDAA